MKPTLSLLTGFFGTAILLQSVAAQTGPTITPGTNLGPIPDSLASGPAAYNGGPRDVYFNVQNRSGSVDRVGISFRANHEFVGDLKVQLIAPDGRRHLLFERTGAESESSDGYSSNLTDTVQYVFGDDTESITGINWWTAANVGEADIPQFNLYNTVVSGGAGISNPPPTTSMTETFRGAQPNGTWILRFEDGWTGFSGEVTNAELLITATGQTRVVTNASDGEGASGTLREALSNAVAGDRITFSENLYANAPSIVIINRRLPPIPDGVAIVGPGANLLSVTRFSTTPFRLFEVGPGHQVTIQGLTVRAGREPGSSGGGVYNNGGNLHLLDVDLVNNSAFSGGGLFSSGRLTLLRSSIRDNSADTLGGGAYIRAVEKTLVSEVSVFQNTGGGLLMIQPASGSSEIRLTHSTFAANTTPQLTLQNPGPDEPPIYLLGNLLTSPSDNISAEWPDLRIVSLGYNMAADDGEGLLDQTGDQINTDPGPVTLDTDSGSTPVLSLSADSAAIDAGRSLGDSMFDGRGAGFNRTEDLDVPNAVGGDGTDIGAYELRNPILFRSRFESQ